MENFLDQYKEINEINNEFIDKKELFEKLFKKYENSPFLRSIENKETDKYYEYLEKILKQKGGVVDKKLNTEIQQVVDTHYLHVYMSPRMPSSYRDTFIEVSQKEKSFILFLIKILIPIMCFVTLFVYIFFSLSEGIDYANSVTPFLLKISLGMFLFMMIIGFFDHLTSRNQWKDGIRDIQRRLKRVEEIYINYTNGKK